MENKMSKEIMKQKIVEISKYKSHGDILHMQEKISVSLLDDKKKDILYRALDIQLEYISRNTKESAMCVESELKIGEM